MLSKPGKENKAIEVRVERSDQTAPYLKSFLGDFRFGGSGNPEQDLHVFHHHVSELKWFWNNLFQQREPLAAHEHFRTAGEAMMEKRGPIRG